MGFIAKLLGAASKAQASGATLDGLAWSVDRITDAPPFFRALPELLPTGSIIYLEDVCSDDGIALARRHCIEPQLKLALGTIWPLPNSFHLPLTFTTASELADFTAHHATPEIAIHLHAYHGGEVTLEWHDAFMAPLRLARTLPEASVRHFCGLLNCNYELEVA